MGDSLLYCAYIQYDHSMQTERDLTSLALGILGGKAGLSVPEMRLCGGIEPAESRTLLNRFRKTIRAGRDPLGDLFSRVRSAEARRSEGATYTPAGIVKAMVGWAARQGEPARIVDPGAGSGRFLIAAAKEFPKAQLIGVETDPLAALVLRANVAALGIARRTRILVGDYRNAKLGNIGGMTLFIGNPPYVRHHDIDKDWKKWFAESSLNFGVRASRLAGLHMHFFLRTLELAREGDCGSFITSAEWLDVNYGSTLRNLLADKMGGAALHVLDPRSLPFSDAATTAAITCFHVGRRPEALLVRFVDNVTQLGKLSRGTLVPWSKVASATRWSTIIRPGPAVPAGFMELGEVCRVHRGQVTGSNHVWIVGPHSPQLPDRVLEPTVTKARDILKANGALSDSSSLRRVADLPEDLDELDADSREEVEYFLKWAKTEGADRSYIAQHRRAWWAVNLKPPAPIICTYMARRPPGFVRNLCGARHINIAHGLYPREAMPGPVLDALTSWLQENVDVSSGRTYAGGLTKFEPKELERVWIPKLENLPA